MSKKIIETTRSKFSESFLYLNGNQLSLKDYPHLRPIYDSEAREIVLMFSRQTAKSTSLANLMISNAAMQPYFKILYIAPTVDQTKVFSRDRVQPVIESSPLIRDHFINSSIVQNVFMKQFLNGSRMYLRYALLNADRIRGYSADMNMFDECQDLKADVIPVIQETMSRSIHKKSIYAGTPKRSKGTLAKLWGDSTRNEYVVKCEHCGHWNILGEDNIGPFGVICSKPTCRRDLNTKRGQWASTYSLTQAPTLDGYRVCLLHFAKAPWVDWKRDVIIKRDRSSRAIFNNEVLALEYDEGTSPITKAEIMRACDPGFEMTGEPTPVDSSYTSIMGVDYGPINSENSHTVIKIMQKRADKVHVVYMKKFLGKEADYAFIHNEIPRLMAKWNVVHIASDYGMGEAPNAEIRSRVGFEKVVAFQHVYSQKEKVRWNPKMPAYTLNRNQVINEFFTAIKRGKIVYPRWQDTEPFAEDLLNVQMEFNEETNSMKYTNIGPDDTMHAGIYALISLELMHGMSEFF